MNNSLFASSFAPPAPNAAIPVQTLCPGNVPLVLLPVRLETRFFLLAGNVMELRVRVYPDRIHVDTHHPELTTDERTVGAQYWQQDWAAGTNVTARSNAWSMLAERFGPERAAWVARVLTPTNSQQRSATPAVPPVFPSLAPVGPNGENAWRHAPQARLLPDKWIAIVHSGGQAALTVTGKPISAPVNVGPDPSAAPPDALTAAAIKAGDALGLDPEMLWLVDFIAAEAKGMALRLTVPSSVLSAGIDSLVVFGVATSVGASNSAAQLADLLDAHHYTDGLEFLRFGTPTNNTDDRRAAYNSEDPGHARSFGLEVVADPDASPNAARVGTALGLPSARIATTLGRIGQASQDHDLDLRSMNTAMWQVGWGYFLSNMVGAETGLTATSIDWARGYFLDWVRSGGPLPSIRCGSQPYGILPVTSLDLWAPGAGEVVTPQEVWLKGLLMNMRDKIWRPALSSTPRIGLRASGDSDADLADVMSTDGVSHGFGTRSVLGRQYLEHLVSYNRQSVASMMAQQDAVALKMLSLLGLPSLPGQRPRQARSFMANQQVSLTVPLVQAGEVSPWQKLQPPYIGELLGLETVNDIIQYRPAPSATDHATPLLKTLLRHALLREIATAAARIAQPALGLSLEALLRDTELVDLVDAGLVNFVIQPPMKTTHWQRQLDQPAPGQPAGTTIRSFIEGLTAYDTLETSALGEFRASLARLQTLDSESLQFLMQGTLDLSAHRLDAWITSYATKRLASMTKGAAGQYIGAYGWVENLKPAISPSPLTAASLPVGETGPVYPLPKDSGFIHAPSLTHASTAALLRNAHLGPDGNPNPNGQFAIDLSSRRVREATRLLDGVRQGQPLGALLGYYLERRLHELRLDAFVAPLRNIAPLVVRDREANGAPTEALAANNVVDGLALIRRKQDLDDTTLAFTIAGVPNTTTGDQQSVNAEIDALIVTVDGLTDALTAEAAYQLVRGNTTRLAGTLSAIAQGDALPPELEVARTPRTGNSLTHRVMMLASALPNTGGGWGLSYNAVPRPLAERWLNAWCRQLLGDASKIRCTVERLDDTGTVVQTVAFPLGQVTLTAIDFMYFAGTAGQTAQGAGALSYAEQYVLYHSRRRPGGFASDDTLRLQHARPTDLAVGETTLFDALEGARAIRRLLENTRGVLPDDISPPERSSSATIDFPDLDARVTRLENTLNVFNKVLGNGVAAGLATTADDFRTAILNLGLLGIGLSVPCVAVGDTPAIRDALLRQATAVQRESAPRFAQCLALRAQPIATDQRARVRQLIERGKVAAGSDFVIMPYFNCDAAAATELTTALAASTAQLGGDPLAANSWFARTARVRDNLSRLGACLRIAEVLGTGNRVNLSIAQLPFDSAERWVGLPLQAGKELPPSKLSLVVQTMLAINPSLPLCGLLFDEWVEVVPNATETTALTFQFDPPNAVAPQNVLVAVPPVPGQDWTTESLRRVLVETLDLAKLRAVDTSRLGAAAQYLPALYVPFNVADAAVSTDFAPLTAS